MRNKKYEECVHDWKFLLDAEKSGYPGSKPWMSFYQCDHCGIQINFLEKSSLDQVHLQKISLEIQKKYHLIGTIIQIAIVITGVVTVVSQFF